VKTISVGNNPWSVAVLPSGEYVYVTNSHNTTVSVIRTADNTVVDVIQVGADPAGLAILPDGNSVYVANSNSNSVSVVGY
jgi:YVTN family beta-propeller protein